MDGQDEEALIRQLENLIMDGNPSEDDTAEIASVLFSIQDSKWQVTPNSKSILNKSAEFMFDSEMRSLIKTKQHSGLRQFLFSLFTKNLTNLDDLLNECIANPKGLEEIHFPDILVRKLMAHYETRAALVTLTKGTMSETLHSLSVSYPSLGQLRSSAWRVIQGQLNNYKTNQNHSITLDERRYVQELWSSQSLLRQSFFTNYLPLELADDLERCNVTALVDLSYEKFQELCHDHDLTDHEKRVFEKLYRKESSFSATRVLAEEKLKQTLSDKIVRAKAIAETIQHQSNSGNDTDTNQLVSQQLETLFLNWNGQQELPAAIMSNSPSNLARISQVLNSADDLLKMLPNPFETDEDLVARIDGGLAFHGLSFGLDAEIVCGLAPQPLFRKPHICVIKETSAQTQKWEEHFFSKEQATNFKKVISEVGFSFGCKLKTPGYGFKAEANFERGTNEKRAEWSSEAKFTKKLTMISVHIYPMASYRIDRDQLMFSMSALRSLQSITDISTAESFLDQYGSHFSSGLHQLGGTLCHSMELTAQHEQSSTSLKELAKKEMNAAVSLEYASLIKVGGHLKEIETSQSSSSTAHQASKISSRSEITVRGPNALQPRLFEEFLRVNSRSWHVIDRDVSPQSLFPIWDLIREKHPNLKPAADLLRKAWLRRTAQINIGIVLDERQRIENRQLTSQDDEKQRKVVALLHKLYAVDVDTVEEGFLLEQFKAFFQALFILDYCNSSSAPIAKEESPWLSYVAKKPKFCQLLEKLAAYHRQKTNESKFQRVFRYLSEAIDSRKLEEMEHDGYPLSDEIRTMLRNYSQESLKDAIDASNASAFQDKLSIVTIYNLVDTLKGEVSNCQNDRAAEYDLQWKIQSILAAVLCSKLIGTANAYQNAIEDLLVKDYNWRNDMFGEEIPLSIEGLAHLVERIHQLEQRVEGWPGNSQSSTAATSSIMSEDDLDEREDFLNENEDDYRSASPTDLLQQQQQHQPNVSNIPTEPGNNYPAEIELSDTEFSLGSVAINNPKWHQWYQRQFEEKKSNNFKKKPFAAFLIDRPFHSVHAQKEPTLHLMTRLRFRMRLEDIDDPDIPEEADAGNLSSLYDTLLLLCDEFDDAGKGEIFRLLLERKSAIPLFLPPRGSQLALLRDVAYNLSNSSTVTLGEDKTLGRIAVVSRREVNESQTSEILKKLFDVESLHYVDVSINCFTKQPTSAEISIGCIVEVKPRAEQGTTSSASSSSSSSIVEAVRHFLILHVVGNFEPLWPFIENFADHLVIEDSVDSAEDAASVVTKLNDIGSVSVWKDTCRQMKVVKSDDTGRYLCIEGSLNRVSEKLKKNILLAFSETGSAQKSLISPKRLRLFEMESHFPEFMQRTAAGYSSAPWDIEAVVNNNCKSLADVRNKQLVLQKNYRQQAIHEQLKRDHQLDDDRREFEISKINECAAEREKEVEKLKQNPLVLLALLQNLLNITDPCSRVLAIRKLERIITLRSEKELEPQLTYIGRLHSTFADLRTKNDFKMMAETNEQLKNARVKYNESVLSIEHLWRELSHMYTAAPSQFGNLPKLAAQHLMDGFPIELLDGDSNLINLQWIQQVLIKLGEMIKKAKQRIFVLSIMGVQSSGKSTLLNTMFGIRMRTSVGQCTRGVNMQLLAVEGRPEYDYILVLDTEGTRAPEYHGLEGSDKRDNQMATLSILLADATIIVNPGENDAAIKEILPIVLMAYQVNLYQTCKYTF